MQKETEPSTEQIMEQETEPQLKSTPVKRTSDREWFIVNKKTNEVWKDKNLYSERECRKAIRVEGEYDVEYTIGYYVTRIEPIVKTTKTILK